MRCVIESINSPFLSPTERLNRALLLSDYPRDLPQAVCEIDLHLHSFYSDGYNSPTMNVFEAYRRNLKAIALSDHDTFDGELEAIRAGEIFGVEIVPAIEFYTDRAGIEIIGHCFDKKLFQDEAFLNEVATVIEPIRQAKKRQLDAMVLRVPACFKPFELTCELLEEDKVTYLRNGMSTKGDISVMLWQKYGTVFQEKELAKNVKEFHTLFTSKKECLDVTLECEIDLSPEAFVKRIRSWGGLPGFAHPVELRHKEGLGNAALKESVLTLWDMGLQTIEVDGWRNQKCPESGVHQTDVFERIRHELNSEYPDRLPLLFTNGSDAHNQPNEGLEMGCGADRNLNPAFGRLDNLDQLKKRVAELSVK